MLESDRNHYASLQSTQCNTHQSTQCNTHQSTQCKPTSRQCNTHQSTQCNTPSTRYNCHWRELPQVFFVATKQNTSFVTTKVCLLQQTYFCRDKTFVTTNVILAKLQQMCLLRQNKCFVVTKVCKSFVATNIILLWQNCCCPKHTFVATNVCVSRQNFCCNKNVTCGCSHQWNATPTSQHSSTWWSDGMLSSYGM